MNYLAQNVYPLGVLLIHATLKTREGGDFIVNASQVSTLDILVNKMNFEVTLRNKLQTYWSRTRLNF